MVNDVQFVPNNNFGKEFFSTTGMVGQHIRRLGTRVLINAKLQVGVDTGHLKASIRSQVKPGATGPYAEVGSSLDHALIHHEGSKPHEIRPRHAKVLRFKQKGIVRYAHRVWHPGTQPNRYLTDSLRKVI